VVAVGQAVYLDPPASVFGMHDLEGREQSLKACVSSLKYAGFKGPLVDSIPASWHHLQSGNEF